MLWREKCGNFAGKNREKCGGREYRNRYLY
jgi:hypothetical protein